MDHSTFLFPTPSAVRGAGRLLDLGGTLTGYQASPNGAIADSRALWHDWAAVGDALLEAADNERAEIEQRVG